MFREMGYNFQNQLKVWGTFFAMAKNGGGGGIILALAYVFMQDGGLNLNY